MRLVTPLSRENHGALSRPQREQASQTISESQPHSQEIAEETEKQIDEARLGPSTIASLVTLW